MSLNRLLPVSASSRITSGVQRSVRSGRYQMFHNQTYGHVVHITFEPLWDMDRAFEQTIRELK